VVSVKRSRVCCWRDGDELTRMLSSEPRIVVAPSPCGDLLAVAAIKIVAGKDEYVAY